MKRAFVLFLFALAVCFSGFAQAQEYTSEAMVQANAEDWADFQAQGEYWYSVGSNRFAVQVIALGKGNFDLVGYPGGFPGEGWHAKKVKVYYSGKRDGDVVTMPCKGFQMLSVDEQMLPLPEKHIGAKAVLYIKDKKVDFVAPDGSIRTATKLDRPNKAVGLAAPEGAFVAYDGKTINLQDGYKLNEEAGTIWADFRTKAFEANKPYHLHIEFMLSFMPNGRGQGRSNSGVYVAEAYECQVLDSFGLMGRNNECGGFYQQVAPAFNACRSPLTWQAYDIFYTPAKYADGKKVENCRMTAFLNGIQIYDDIELKSNTPGCKGEPADGEARGVYLQGHGNKVQYRNIWVDYLK